MPTAELTEQSTTAEVESYAAQVVEEVQAERAGSDPPPKDDARLAVEHADNEHKEITAGKERPSGAESAGVENDPGEETGASEGRDWLTDELKAEAAAYGVEESEIADFASREELERALRLFDKSALAAGRKALAEQEAQAGQGRTRNEKGRFEKAPQTAPEPDGKTPEGRYEIALDKDVYDEAIVSEFARLRDHYESRLEALEGRFGEAEARAEEQRFDGLVDSLGHADLFGKTGRETDQELQRRKDLHVAVKAQQIGLAQLGRPTDMNESLVDRVTRMVFAEDLGRKDLKNRTRKISKQSNGRQGGGATRPQDPREDPRDEFDRLYKEMERA